MSTPPASPATPPPPQRDACFSGFASDNPSRWRHRPRAGERLELPRHDEARYFPAAGNVAKSDRFHSGMTQPLILSASIVVDQVGVPACFEERPEHKNKAARDEHEQRRNAAKTQRMRFRHFISLLLRKKTCGTSC